MAGGQATNTGINYQQRVSAFLLTCLLTEFDISEHLNLLGIKIGMYKIFFESEQPIDDLIIECKPEQKLFFQIKRSLSLSSQQDSEFVKTINQFIREFILNPFEQSKFGLITSSNSSRKIIHDLKKILCSINLNDSSFKENPLNQSERNTLTKFQEVFFSLYKKNTGKHPTNLQFLQFSKRCFVGIFDIDSGQPLELAAHMLLQSHGFKSPELVWSLLVKNSLIYGSQRLSIQKQNLNELLSKYRIKKSKVSASNVEELLKTTITIKGDIPVEKEVLLLESFSTDYDFMVIEIARFTNDGQKKNVFYSNKVKIISGYEWTVAHRFAAMFGLNKHIEENNLEWTVIRRFATVLGLNRYLEEGNLKTEKANIKVLFLPGDAINSLEDTERVKLHKTHLQFLLEQNSSPLICIHCGKRIGTTDCFQVEIDDRDSYEAVGLVHNKCLRPIDRIIGKPYFEKPNQSKHLNEFDFKAWVKLSLKGQGMLNKLKYSPQITQGKNAIILWNPNEEYDREYSYCIRFLLENKTFVYEYNRNKIIRLNKLQAQENLHFFNESIEKMRKENDPWCRTSIHQTSGRYSELVRVKDREEEVLEVKKAEIVKYSKQIAKLFDKDLYYYAPICLVREQENELIVRMGNIIPLVSNPLIIDDLIKNWNKLGFDFQKVELKIIKTDKDFDNNMRMFFSDDLVPVIDPEFDKSANLVKGYPIQIFEEFIEQSKENDTKTI